MASVKEMLVSGFAKKMLASPQIEMMVAKNVAANKPMVAPAIA